MKRFGKKAIVFFLAAVFAAAAVVPAFAADKTAVGKIYLTIDGTVGLKDDSEDVTVTPYGDNTDRYYVDSIYIENNDGNGYTESNPPKVTVTLSVADEDSCYFSGTASKDFRLTLSDSAKSGYGKAEYVKAVKRDDRSTLERHGKVDDYPYGGGAGMVMQAEPIYRAYEALVEKIGKKPRVIYMTPQGKTFNQNIAEDLAKEEDLVFLCGHYEGVDERVLEMIATDYLSAGDYVLTGGELPAMMMIDCISRLVPGVLNNNVSAEFETFHDNLLEYPQYTRPEVFMGKKVPDILLSGHHANVEKWRREQSIIRTLKNRPELLEDAVLSKKEQKFLDELLRQQETEKP